MAGTCQHAVFGWYSSVQSWMTVNSLVAAGWKQNLSWSFLATNKVLVTCKKILPPISPQRRILLRGKSPATEGNIFTALVFRFYAQNVLLSFVLWWASNYDNYDLGKMRQYACPRNLAQAATRCLYLSYKNVVIWHAKYFAVEPLVYMRPHANI